MLSDLVIATDGSEASNRMVDCLTGLRGRAEPAQAL